MPTAPIWDLESIFPGGSKQVTFHGTIHLLVFRTVI